MPLLFIQCAVTLEAAKKKHKSSVDMFISRKALQAFLQIDIKHLMECLQTLLMSIRWGALSIFGFGSFDFLHLRHFLQNGFYLLKLFGSFSLQAQHTNTVTGHYKT